MSLSYTPSGRTGFVPRPCGFGATLMGVDAAVARTDGAEAIRATRQERDLLRGDLTLVGADGTLLPEALGCELVLTGGSWSPVPGAGGDPEEWDMLELGDAEDHAAIATALAVVHALTREGPVGVVLTGPITLAELVAGRESPVVDADDEALVDACAIAVLDAAKAVLDAGGHVVLEERRAPSSEELGLCTPLLKMLAHHRRPALALVRGDSAGALGDGHDAIGATAVGAAAPDWGAAWEPPADAVVFSPRIAADASPERVQELLRGLRAGAIA